MDMATLGAESEATVNSSEKEGKSEELMSGRHAVTTPIIAGTTLGYLGETDEESSSNLALSREALSQSILLELHAAAKEEAGEAVVEAEEMPCELVRRRCDGTELIVVVLLRSDISFVL